MNARLLVGSSVSVKSPLATDSPILPAKNDLPLTTASPERAEPTTERRVETTRGSKTTVHRADRAFCAPSRRVERSTASALASSGSSWSGDRPTLKPVPVCESAPSPAMASTETNAVVRRVSDRIPVVEASATSTRLSE